MGDTIRLDASDVTVVEIEPDVCDECADELATHYVLVDFRSLGQERDIGRYCRNCAENVATRIREGLQA